MWENVNISIDWRSVCVHAISTQLVTLANLPWRACTLHWLAASPIAWTQTGRHSFLNLIWSLQLHHCIFYISTTKTILYRRHVRDVKRVCLISNVQWIANAHENYVTFKCKWDVSHRSFMFLTYLHGIYISLICDQYSSRPTSDTYTTNL